MQSQTKKRLYVLLTCALLACVAVGTLYLVRRHQLHARFARYKVDGLAASARGDDAIAVQQLGLYLQREPGDVDALSAFAKSRLRVGSPRGEHVRDAIMALRALVRLQPGRMDERVQLADLYLQAGFLTEALDATGYVMEHVPVGSPQYLQALPKRVSAMSRLRKFAEAEDWARKWTEAAPADVTAQTTRLWLMKQGGKSAVEIRDVAKKLGTAEGTDAGSLFLMGYAHRLNGDWAEAVRALGAAGKQPSADVPLERALVDELNRVGLFNDSRSVLERLYNASPTPELRNELGRRYWEVGSFEDADQMLQAVDPADPKSDRDMLAIRALSLQALKRENDAATMRAALSGRRDDPVAQVWEIVLAQQFESKLADARRLAAAAAAALAREPDNLFVHYFAGEAHYRLGESDVAIREWETVATQNPTWSRPVARLAALFAELGRIETAYDVAREAVQRSPADGVAVLTWVRVWAAAIESGRRRDVDDLLALVTEIQKGAPQEEETLALRVALLGRSGKADAAKEALRAGLARPEKMAEATYLRLAATSRTYKLGLESACFDGAQAHYGKTPALAFARAVNAFAEGHGADGAKFFADRGPAPSAADDEFMWEYNRTRYLEMLRDGEAKARVVELADKYPADLRAQQFAVSAWSVRGDRVFLAKTISRVKALSGERSITWEVARARWCINFGGAAEESEATALLQDVAKRVPDMAEARYLLARVHEHGRKWTDAIGQLQPVVEANPSVTSLGLYLARLYQSNGDYDRARAQLERVAAMNLVETDQRRQAAALLAQQGDAQRAIELLEEEMRQSSDQGEADLLLASLYRQRNEPQKAQAIYDRLLEHPNPPVIKFAADLMASLGRREEAKTLLAKLDQLEMDPVDRLLAKADFAARHGERPDDARDLYDDAINNGPTNVDAWRSKIVFQVASGDPAGALETNTKAAKALPGEESFVLIAKQKGVLYFASGDLALRALVVNFVRDPIEAGAAATALKAIQDARDTRKAPSELVLQLAAIADRNTRLLPLQLLVAQMYLSQHRPEDALTYGTRATQISPTSPEPFRVQAAIFADAGRWAEAREAGKKWRDRDVRDPRRADLFLAECEVNLGAAGEALARLAPYVTDPAAEGYDQAIKTFAKAQELAGKGGAAALMEPLLKKGPSGRQAWLSYALQNLPPVEAATWFDRAASAIPENALAEQVSLAGYWGELYAISGDAQYSAKARAILAPRAAASGAPAPVLVAMGAQEEAEQQWAKATERYRDALKLEPDNLIAKNNLAMVLARQGQMTEALAFGKMLVASRPEVPEFYDTLAFVQLRANRVDDAIATLRTAINLQRNNVTYRISLAEAFLAKQDLNQARVTVQEIDALKPRLDHVSLERRTQLERIRAAVKSPVATGQGQ